MAEPVNIPLPSALAEKVRVVRLGGRVPALLAHPDWLSPVPTLIWLHGRTVQKELDNGRYLRLIRAGIAVCAVDLPGHGERYDPEFHQPERTLDLLDAARGEIDPIVESLGAPSFAGVFDGGRIALGGMSAGGMVTLRRLCEPHGFAAAAVEGTAGNLQRLYVESPPPGLKVRHSSERVASLDPMTRLGGWRPIPLLALHSAADEVVPVACLTTFIQALRERYAAAGADPALIELKTWPATGAPQEHNGFGRVASEAKSLQVEFLSRAFGLTGLG